MKLYKIATVLSLCTLVACKEGPNIAELCEQQASICQEFQQDTWCNQELITVGFANFSHKVEVNDSNKFQQLIAYEAYEKCMLKVSKIDHFKLKIKKKMRVNNANKAQKKIKAIALATKNSEHPDLLFFHWSRYLNKPSLNKFIALEGNKLLERPNRQVNLASYYTKIDTKKTLNILYHALELYPSNAAVDTNIFKSIISIFTDKKKPKQVYIWSKILHLYSPKDNDISNKSLKIYAKNNGLNSKFLDRVAKATLNNIIAGKFKSPQR